MRPKTKPLPMIDVLIHSDGSSRSPDTKGGTKYPGGCAAVLTFPEDPRCPHLEHRVAVSGEKATTIGRMELLGLLVGIKYALHLSAPPLQAKDLNVMATTDSMYLVQAATGQSGRKKGLDLWRTFDTLGRRFGRFSIEFRPRNTLPEMIEADRVAGEARELLMSGHQSAVYSHTLPCMS